MICGLTCEGCCDGARENEIVSMIGRLMGVCGEPARVSGHVGRNDKVSEGTRRFVALATAGRRLALLCCLGLSVGLLGLWTRKNGKL